MSVLSRSRKRSTTSATRRSSLRSISRSLVNPSRESTRTNQEMTERNSRNNQVSAKNDPCVCGPNLYQKVFGPTADETILVGLQTFMGLCEECPQKIDEVKDEGTEEEVDEEDMEEEREQEQEQEEDTQSEDPTQKVIADEIKASQKPSFSDTHSESSQTDPCDLKHCFSQTGDARRAGGSQTDYCITNACAQTQNPCVKVACSQSYFPSAMSQTYIPCKKCILLQTDACKCPDIPVGPCAHCRKKSIQSKSCSKSKSRTTRASSFKASTDSCCCHVGTESEESPPSFCCCSDSISQSKSKNATRKSTLKTSSICSCCRSATARETTTTSSKKCTCSSSKPKSQRQVRLYCDCCTTTSSSGFEEPDETVNGTGTCMEMGDNNQATIRYAITKITNFFSYTTFEVMKSTSKKPRVMPKTLEGVFVLKKCS